MKALNLNVAIGSIRPPKVEAVRAVLAQIAPLLEIKPGNVNYIAREVPSGVSMVPLSIHEIRRGAYNRAAEVRRLIEEEYGPVDFAIGLEGGLFILNEEKSERVHLQSWVYVERFGEGYYGSSMSMPIPSQMAHAVIEQKQDLSKVIDRYSGRDNVRSHDGAFGFLSRGFFDRQQAFELALLGAFAPFYHAQIYQPE